MESILRIIRTDRRSLNDYFLAGMEASRIARKRLHTLQLISDSCRWILNWYTMPRKKGFGMLRWDSAKKAKDV